MKNQPPKIVEKLFSFFCGKAFLEDLLGDLYEMYEYKRATSSRFTTNIYYWYQAFRLLFSYAITKRKRERSLSSYSQSHKLNTMLLNYIKISFRNIAKNKTFALLNIFGLGLGMSIGLVALAFYVEINQFDRFHTDSDKLYRVTTEIKDNGTKTEYASVPPALSYMLEKQLTGLDQSVHINDQFSPMVKTAGEPIRLYGYHTQPSFLDVFNFPLASGSKTALQQPGIVILTHETAEKFFKDKPALGQSLETENYGKLQVGGVLKPFPKYTHFSFDMLTGIPPNHGLSESNSTNWTSFNRNFFYIKSDLTPTQIASQVSSMARSGIPFFDNKNLETDYSIQPIKQINPGVDMQDALGNVFNREAILAFFGMALLILIPACLNYGNMAVANALKRSKEIGIRKIMGSPNRQIIHQFIMETIVICLLSLLLSLFIFNLIRAELLSMLVGGTSLSFSLSPTLLLIFFLFAVATGIFTGLLPAMYFSRITPIKAIRQTINNQKISISGLRKGLLVFQFVLSLVFMIGIGVLLKQYNLSIHYDKGFDRENVLILPVSGKDHQLIANTMSSAPAITDLSFTSSMPGTPIAQSLHFYSKSGLDSVNAKVLYTGKGFIKHMDIKMHWGSGILKESEFEQVIVNQQLMKKLTNIRGEQSDSLLAQMANGKQVQIVGIVQDYNHEPLNSQIEPMVVRLDKSELDYALFTVSTNDIMSTMTDLEARWESIFPEAEFEATFLDHEIEKTYYFIITGIKLFGFLGLLAVTISCLGLLGMVIYTTENRRKEVAIRKTLGAGTGRLLYSLSGLFFKMWAIALVIAIPLSYIYYDSVMLRVYNKFSSGVGFSEIALSSLLTLALGMMAILIQSVKVMRTNPAENLRSE